jgi:hypothetical protein
LHSGFFVLTTLHANNREACLLLVISDGVVKLGIYQITCRLFQSMIFGRQICILPSVSIGDKFKKITVKWNGIEATYIYTHTYIHTYVSTYVHTCIITYIHRNKHKHAYTHTYIYTYVHIYTHTHRHTYMRASLHVRCVRAMTQALS